MNMEKKYKRILAVLFAVLVLDLILLCACLIDIDRVDVKSYPVTTDFGTMTAEEIEVFRNILAAAENDVAEVPYNSGINKHRALTHLGLYYGSMQEVTQLCVWTENAILLNLDVFKKLQENKVIIDARVDEAVSTFAEGTDRFKLWQICNYLSDRITYTDGVRETINGLNGEGVCSTYSMLFYKMAMRVGIKSYICYGYVGEYHSWNVVELNGSLYHYDATFYDTDSILHDYRYLHSACSWGREYQINNLWWEE